MRSTILSALLGVLFVSAAGAADEAQRGVILLYAAYGSSHQLVVEGRVLEDEGVRAADPQRSGLSNLVDTFKAFESDEIGGVELRLTVDGQSFTARTDDDGCFRLAVREMPRSLKAGQRPLSIEASSPPGYAIASIWSTASILAPDAVALISDFDDTVAETGVADKKRMFVRTLTRNAAQMLPVAGAAQAFNEAIAAGAAGVFYVSGSPQNLQPRIVEFLWRQEIPVGPLLLKNLGEDSLTEQEGYKLRRIEELLAAMPGVRFALVGDSGEKDPEVYRSVLSQHPTRVAGIIIRRVDGVDNGGERLAGMQSLDDFARDPSLIAKMVAEARAAPQ